MFSPSNSTAGWLSYARSKLAIATCYLDRIEGIQAIGVHPGAVRAAFSDNILLRMRKFLKTIQEDGARMWLNVLKKAINQSLSEMIPNTITFLTEFQVNEMKLI